MAAELSGMRIAFLATDGVEQTELTEPWEAVRAAGGTPELVSLEPGRIQGFEHLDRADTFPVDRVVADASADDYLRGRRAGVEPQARRPAGVLRQARRGDGRGPS